MGHRLQLHASSLKTLRFAIVCLVLAGFAGVADAQVDRSLAESYFKAVQVLCERDGGRLWGVPICGPMVIGDMRTQTFATSEPAPEAPRPAIIGLVNAPVQWGGRTWGAYVWDFAFNDTPRQRNELLLHELFHLVQPQLGLSTLARSNEHLDSVDGRYWLQLEWRALAQALRESAESRKAAVRDALAFRHTRRAGFEGAAESERASEIGEGLAQYTATVLAAPNATEAVASALDQLARAEKQESFIRTFAYTSGAAYGVLLDAASPGWPRRIKATDDLGALLMQALDIQPSRDPAQSAERFDGKALRAAEEQRELQRQERLAELRRRFIDSPVLIIQGGGRGASDARGAVAIPGAGTVYFGTYRFSGDWGTLEAEKGVLVANDGGSRRLSGPVRHDDGTASGDGWTFRPAPGWILREGPRQGDFEVVRR